MAELHRTVNPALRNSESSNLSSTTTQATNAGVGQLVESVVLETIKWKFESFHRYQKRTNKKLQKDGWVA